MSYDIALIMLVANAALLTMLGWRMWKLGRSVEVLTVDAEALARNPQELPPDLLKIAGEGPRQLIVVDILNPMTLASERSWVADKLGSMSPGLIRKLVLQQARDQLREELRLKGVEADVRVVRLD